MSKRSTPEAPFKPPAKKCQDIKDTKSEECLEHVTTQLEKLQESIDDLHDMLLEVLQKRNMDDVESSQSSDL